MTKTRKTNVLSFYAAPERLNNPAMKLTKALDVYTFAISTYVMLTGRFPLVEERTYSKNIYECMQNLNAQDKQSINVIVDLMEKCLNDDPLKRPTMKEVADVLLKLLDEQDKDVLLEQVETVTWSVRNMFDFSNLEKLVPISELTPFYVFDQPSSEYIFAHIINI
uniref:Receptor-interacting serine/threonine-protein kinase 1-like n=1 Tax=Phallusia mammillata TaxID=59560 RepID=A0A6F9DRS6_9ASCI|nr:receptor-interacting serine/threonine-protein kinase 1-like [Phallusia mammillata]